MLRGARNKDEYLLLKWRQKKNYEIKKKLNPVHLILPAPSTVATTSSKGIKGKMAQVCIASLRALHAAPTQG
jgi:hypothetical protein